MKTFLVKASVVAWVLFPSWPVHGADGQPPDVPPNSNRPGPWDNDVVVYRVGRERQAEKLTTFERAGVPTAARLKDGRLLAAFQHFPRDDSRHFDRVAVRFSSDEGRTWTPAQPIAVDGMESGLARPFDPTLVPLPDGRVRLYFTSNRSPDFRRSTPAIYSALSTDGIQYAFEPGIRFAVEGRLVIDCAVALHDGLFHLIVPDNGTAAEMMMGQQGRKPPPGGTGYHAVSRDGLVFERVEDVTHPSRDRWLGNLQSDGGRLVFFGTGEGLWPLTSVDGVSWRLDANPVRVPGADPGVVKLRDGSWLLVVTGPPRPGTPSARMGPRGR
ncbi:MAG: exo-alpha-sialidase [Planctomycetes bacterium]|nr:exo-alpha-sialidase [Planctomycetota bacterium]